MIYKGRELNFRALWEELGVSIPENDSGAFSRLLHCPHPEHENKRSPAFQVNLTKPLVNCFGAGCFGSDNKPGTYEYAIKAIMGCTEKEAQRFILRFTRASLGVDVEQFSGAGMRKTITGDSAMAKDAERLERGEFTYLPTAAREYLDSRGLSPGTRGKWQIGWDEETERIVIPGFDERGALRFLIRRAIDQRKPKYLYTEGAVKASVLFGLLHVPRNERMLTLVEGSIDVAHLHELGVTSAVGTLGSGLSAQQVRIIDRRAPERVYLMYDPDAAGVSNVLDAFKKLPRLPLFVCLSPNRKDPAQLLRVEAERSIERALPRHEFMRRLSKMTTPQRRRQKEVV